MSKPGYHQVELSNIFQRVTGHAVDPSERLAIDFKRASVVTDEHGSRLQATFTDPQTGKPINMRAADVGRLQEWTSAATIEARNDYAREQREYAADYKDYGRMRQMAYADGKLSADERETLAEKRAELAVSRQEAVEAHRDYQGFVSQHNEVSQAMKAMHEVRQDHNDRIQLKGMLGPAGLI